jgi:hypothetical protein
MMNWLLSNGPVTVVCSGKAPGKAFATRAKPFPDPRQEFRTMSDALQAIRNNTSYEIYLSHIESSLGKVIWTKYEVEEVLERTRSPLAY